MKTALRVLAVSVCLSFGTAHAADDLTAWLADRQAKYAQYQAVHPNLDGEIAALKARAGTFRPVGPYAGLLERSSRLSPAQRMEALNYFRNGYDLWKAGNYLPAEQAFRRGLDIDPANDMANFYYADCLQRRGDSVGAREYYNRAVALGKGSETALKAEAALKSLPQANTTTWKRFEAPTPPVIRRIAGAITEIWDCAECPRLTVIPPGEFSMGARYAKPVHWVAIPRPFAAGTFEVTRGEYGRFAAETGRGWSPPKFDQTPDHPVVNVSWDDAKAYVAWLSQKTGKTYRLLSESEWEYAARAESTTEFPWGDEIDRSRANYGDEGNVGFADGNDRWVNTAPVGQFPANGFGLYDAVGNVWEWIEDCWNPDYVGASSDEQAWLSGDCSKRVVRDGSWSQRAASIGTARRGRLPMSDRYESGGIRIAREL